MSPATHRPTPLSRRLRNAVGFSTLLLASMAMECPDETPVQATPEIVVPAGSSLTVWDTVSVGDVLTYADFRVTTASGAEIVGLRNRWEVSDATKLQLMTPPERAFNFTIPIRATALAAGQVQLAALPLGVSFANNDPQRFVANILIRASKPVILDVPSNVALRVGEAVTLTAKPTANDGGTFTVGATTWRTADFGVVALDFPGLGGGGAGLNEIPAPKPNIPVDIRGKAVGQTTVTLTYQNGSVTLQKVINVTVAPNDARVEISRTGVQTSAVANDVIYLSSRLLDANGGAVDQRLIQYTSRDPLLATPVRSTDCARTSSSAGYCSTGIRFDAAEVARRGGVARVTIVASAPGARSDEIELTVYNAVDRITILPANDTIAVGAQKDFTVHYFDSRGVAIPRAAFGAGAEFLDPTTSLFEPAVATVVKKSTTANDSVAVLAESINYSSQTSSGTADITLRARLLLKTIENDGSDGASTAVNASTNVHLRAVARVVVTPATTALTVGGAAQRLVAELFDGANRPVTNPLAITWESSNTAVATVVTNADRSATVTPVGPGTAQVIATVVRVKGQGTVTVTAAPAVTVSIVSSPRGPTNDPASALTPVARTATRTYQLLNAQGAVITTGIAWTSSNTAVADISSAGVATCLSAAGGTVTITATAAGASATTTLVCAAGTSTSSRVAFIVLDPRNPEITAPATLQFTVRYLDVLGNVTTPETTDGGTTVFSSAPGSATAVSGATIDASTGLATALNPGGLSTIRAEYRKGGQLIAADETKLLVNPPTAGNYRSIVISTSGNVRSVKLGESVLFQVIILDASGNQVTSGVDPLNVGSSDPSALQVTRDTRFPSAYFYQVRGLKVSTAGTATDPLANVPVLAASVNGASTTLKFVVTP